MQSQIILGREVDMFSYRYILLVAVTAGLLAVGAGCSRTASATVTKRIPGETIRGTVTYRGKPVPYGFVLLYGEHSLSPETGIITPTNVGPIGSDGTYEITDVPAGSVMVAIATDPNADPIELMRPMLPGEADVGPMPIPNGPPMPDRTLPPDTAPAGTWDLTPEQKKDLQAIHAKYGSFGKGGLSTVVPAGGLVYDITLE